MRSVIWQVLVPDSVDSANNPGRLVDLLVCLEFIDLFILYSLYILQIFIFAIVFISNTCDNNLVNIMASICLLHSTNCCFHRTEQARGKYQIEYEKCNA